MLILLILSIITLCFIIYLISNVSNNNNEYFYENPNPAKNNIKNDIVYSDIGQHARNKQTISSLSGEGIDNPGNISRIYSSFQNRPPEENNPSYEQMEKDRVRNNIDFNLFNTLTFNDVLVYDNEPGGRLGLDRCLDNKVGTCVPYGNMTGIAYYYPPEYNELTYGDIINAEQTPDERIDPYLGIITYPNLR